MDAQFWIKAWTEGRTQFNRADYHEKLVQYFPQLKPQPGKKVLVPLCGKSVDMIWLAGEGLHVHGVELHAAAVREFFSENQLPSATERQTRDFIEISGGGITVSCGDFFKLDCADTFDFVYDRAALVALPASMREEYVRVISHSLKKGGKCLLIAYEYDQSKMEGPPFSVDSAEITKLYHEAFHIRRLESEMPAGEGGRLSAVEGLRQTVTILEKK